ncbi:hypothetical protein LCGC14_1977640, partial [marine sediment metagenome]
NPFHGQTHGDPDIEPGILLIEETDDDGNSKAATTLVKMWDAQHDIMAIREAQWDVNERRRAGEKNVQLRRRDQDDDRSWFCWTNPRTVLTPDAIASMNKAATLCRKFASLMWADPPAPDAMPSDGTDEARDAAEFSNRALIHEQQRLQTAKKGRRAFDRASTFGSGFTYYTMRSSERVKKEVSAGFELDQAGDMVEAAQHVDEAARRPDGTGWSEYRSMYVMEDGTLTEDMAQGVEENVPQLHEEVLTGRNVRFIPHSAEDIWDAHGAMVAAFPTWGELRRQFPELDDIEDDEKEKLFDYKPARAKRFMTPQERRTWNSRPEDDDEKLVFTLAAYYTGCPDYPKGAYLLTVGGVKALEQTEWSFESDGREIALPIPLSQYAQFSEGDTSPYTYGMMHLIGLGNEIRQQMVAALQDHVQWMLNRKTFVPVSSILRAQDLKQAGRALIQINKDGKPSYEEIPPFPAEGMNLFTMSTDEMEHDTGLGDVATGLESPQVQSGKHAQAIVAQVHSTLSDVRQNNIDGYLRDCEIQLMMIRAFYSSETRIGWVGEDGAYKEREWTGADLGQTSQVQLKAGTMTMLTPTAKTTVAYQFASFGLIQPDQLRDVISANLGGLLGVQDMPELLRIRRQIAGWKQGPPEDWEPAMDEQPVIDPQTGTPIMNPDGTPVTEEVQVMDQVLGGIWRAYPADDLPFVALLRLHELSKLMSKSEFSEQPPEWQFGVFEEFARTQMVATPQGMQPGQQPESRSPAQSTQGPLAQG